MQVSFSPIRFLSESFFLPPRHSRSLLPTGLSLVVEDLTMSLRSQVGLRTLVAAVLELAGRVEDSLYKLYYKFTITAPMIALDLLPC
jgi:hypothetical protein